MSPYVLAYFMKTIPTFVHGIFDYIVGIVLLVAPNLFGFADMGGPAVMIPRVLGVLILVQALMTNYELGLIRVIPMKLHLAVDYILTLFLAVSPWLFGFYAQPKHVWMPHLVVGVCAFVLALMTETVPHERAVGTETRAAH